MLGRTAMPIVDFGSQVNSAPSISRCLRGKEAIATTGSGDPAGEVLLSIGTVAERSIRAIANYGRGSGGVTNLGTG